MIRGLLLTLLIVSFLTGCSTTRQPTAVNKMQIKMAQMERKLESKDKEIEELNYQIRALESQLGEVDEYEDSSPIEEPLLSFEPDEPVQASSKSTVRSTTTDKIIRVAVSARKVQTALKNAGYYEAAIDGKVGRRTKQAIVDFQKDNELVPDGLVGRKTWAELKTYLE